VIKALSTSDPRLEGRMLRETLTDPDTGEVIAAKASA
jgi:hypothetical protein